jgi:hypothetical protein
VCDVGGALWKELKFADYIENARPVIVLSYLLAAPSLPFVRDIKHDTARLSTWKVEIYLNWYANSIR